MYFLQIVFYLYLHGLVIFLFPNFVLQNFFYKTNNDILPMAIRRYSLLTRSLRFLLSTPFGESPGTGVYLSLIHGTFLFDNFIVAALPMVFRRNVELLVAADVDAGDDYDADDDDDDDDDDDSDAGCAGDKTAAALAASTAAAAAALPAKISLIIKRERFGFMFDIFLCSSIAVVAVVRAGLKIVTESFIATFALLMWIHYRIDACGYDETAPTSADDDDDDDDNNTDDDHNDDDDDGDVNRKPFNILAYFL
uniref:Uncharacterized protein n=1 Tax=Glossina austeni TaxID=7395 RepID=A0A1A9VBZ8_GLOAU